MRVLAPRSVSSDEHLRVWNIASGEMIAARHLRTRLTAVTACFVPAADAAGARANAVARKAPEKAKAASKAKQAKQASSSKSFKRKGDEQSAASAKPSAKKATSK